MTIRKQLLTYMTNSKNQDTTEINRIIRAGLFISLDGVAESPNLWQKVFDDEMGEEMGKVLPTQDVLLLGRKTYEEWAQYWPSNTEDPFAEYINNIHKYVVSSTLDKVEWGEFDNITLLKTLDEVKELKHQKGKTIGMSGSITLVTSLLKAGLLDELFLMIHPVVVGKGKRLFEGSDTLKHLNLTYSKVTSSGTIVVKYTPSDES